MDNTVQNKNISQDASPNVEAQAAPTLSERVSAANGNRKVKKVFHICLASSAVLFIASAILLICCLKKVEAFGAATDSVYSLSLWGTILFGITLVLSAIRKQTVYFGLWFAGIWAKLTKKHPTLFEFIRYWLVANVTTIIDYIITFLMLWLIFAKLQETPFEWTIGNFTVFKYAAGKGMGLAAFLAYVISFLVSNVYGFIAQRKIAFKANNNVALSAIAFSVATLIILFITQFLPQFYMEWLYDKVGAGLGSVLIKFFNCCIGLWAMYPVNKFIIMRKIDSDKAKAAE